MTAEQPKEHCDHEVVCRHHFQSDYMAGVPCKDKCAYDTRSRPHPAPAQTAYPLTDADIVELIDYANAEDAAACIKNICEKIKARRIDNAFGYENICNQEKCIKQRADAARQAREDVLDAIIKWKRKNCFWVMVDTITGQKRYHFNPAQFEEYIESLRGDRT